MKLILSLILFLNSAFALGADRTIACDGTDCKVKVYSRVGSALTESGSFSGGGMTQVATTYATDANKVLVSTDNRHQVFTGLSVTRDVTLPTTGILANEVWRIENTTTFDLVVKASNGSALTLANSANIDATINKGFVLLRSTQATPTTPAHWRVVEVSEVGTYTASVGGALTSIGTATVTYLRNNKSVTLNIQGAPISPSGASTTTLAGTNMPTRCRPIIIIQAPVHLFHASNFSVGWVNVASTDGLLTFGLYNNVAFSNSAGFSGGSGQYTSFTYFQGL